jgi:ATP-binding cassette, subfamily B, multidrug efflux pump
MIKSILKITSPLLKNAAPKNSKDLLDFFIENSEGYLKWLTLICVLSALTALLEVYLFTLLKTIVDALPNINHDEFWVSYGYKFTATLAAALLFLFVVSVLHILVSNHVIHSSYPISAKWRSHLKILSQNVGFFQGELSGNIVSIVDQASQAIRDCSLKICNVLTYVIVFLGAVLLILFKLDKLLIIPFIIWFAVYIVLLKLYLPKLRHAASRHSKASAHLNGFLTDTYRNIKVVKTLSTYSNEEKVIKQKLLTLFMRLSQEMSYLSSLQIRLWVINVLLIFSVTTLASYLWSTTSISIGAFAASTAIVLRIYGVSQWIMWEVSFLFESIGILQNGKNLLSGCTDSHDFGKADEITGDEFDIEFKNVFFGYGQSGNLIINDLNLKIKAGEKIGVIGKSGAGKTTLINLLLRLYDSSSGNILLNSKDIKSISKESLRSKIGIVTQDVTLFNRSIRENICYGLDGVSEERLIDACKAAAAHDFIISQVDSAGYRSYDASVGDGGLNLSGGQRQRICLARMILKNAPILILDEATSALDSASEAQVQNNLDNIMKNRTVIVIAHKLSTIAKLDRLIVIDDGRVAEEGSHSELIEAKGIYWQHWKKQLNGMLNI